MSVHEARKNPVGIRYLHDTGQLKPYLEKALEARQREFIAWDGEGWTDYDDMSGGGFAHKYSLLMNSHGTYIEAPRLDTKSCLELILSEGAKNRKAIHFMFAGGYDATHILRDLPPELAVTLRDDNEVFWTVEDDEHPNSFTFRYLPHKWLQVTGFDWYSRTWVTVKIFDIMTFFQTSALKAWDSRGIHVPDEVRGGKAARGHFTWEDRDEVRKYCAIELDLYVELAEQLRRETEEAGLKINQWHGPAVIAKALFRKYGVRKHMARPPLEVEIASQYAFHAGHFEPYQIGHYEGKLELNDIHSAYPYALAQLPSLAGGKWEWSDTFDPDMHGLWKVSYTDFERDSYKPHPLPWRGPHGEIGYPNHNPETWAYTPEASIAGVAVQGGWILKPVTDVRPFAFMETLYNLRREWKEAGRGGEKALKLGMNSGYGVTAQRVSADGQPPSWHSLVWAGMITSITRRILWDAIMQDPESVVAVETDSILSTRPLQLDFGDRLGQWDRTELDWVTYIQSGIYLSSDGVGKTKTRTRGIDTRELNADEVHHWLRSEAREPLLVNARNFIGLGNPRTYLYGKWQDSTKEVRLGGGKRVHNPGTCQACADGISLADGLHRLEVTPNYGYTPSAKHPLPWMGDTITPQTELAPVGQAVQEYDLERRMNA
jgi:hypothetical protein